MAKGDRERYIDRKRLTKGCVYKITNLVNGKEYVGVSVEGEVVRWKEHLWSARRGDNYLLPRAIRKYGEEAFAVVVLHKSFYWRRLCRLEKDCIKKYGTKHPKGYNLTDGGEGIVGLARTKEWRKAISVARKGIKFTAEHCANLSRALKGRPGRSFTDAIKRKMSIRAKQIGADPEERKRRSERAKRQHAEGRLGRGTWSRNSERSFRRKMKGRPGKPEQARWPVEYWNRPENRGKRSAWCKSNPKEMSRRAKVYWGSLTPEEREERIQKVTQNPERNAKIGATLRKKFAIKRKAKNGEGRPRSMYRPETAYVV